MSEGIAAVISRISQIRSAIGGGSGGVLGVANTGDRRFSDALSQATDKPKTGAGTTGSASGAAAPDPLERAAISARAARSARPLGAKPAGWPDGVPAEAEAYADEFEAAAAATGVPIEVLLAVAWAESGFNPDAVSSAGAQGMMQLMPATGEGMGVTDPFDAGQNILGGAHYLKVQYERFGSWDLAFAAYNAGPGAVQQYGGVPPYPETRSYVAILNGYLEQMTPTAAATPVTAAAASSERASIVPRDSGAANPAAQDRAALHHQRSALGSSAASLSLNPSAAGAVGAGTALSGTAITGAGFGEATAVAGIDHRAMEQITFRLGLAGTIPQSMVPAGVGPVGLSLLGGGAGGAQAGVEGANASAVVTAPALPVTLPSPATTASLTSTVAALPASLVALIQRSQHNGNGPQRLTIRLDPPELGRLDVLFEVRGDQVAVVVRPESAGAGTLMSNQRGRIAEALAQQGLQLSGFDVATGGGDRNPDRRPGPLSRVYPGNEVDPIDQLQLTVDRALRL